MEEGGVKIIYNGLHLGEAQEHQSNLGRGTCHEGALIALPSPDTRKRFLDLGRMVFWDASSWDASFMK